ncbi:MAG TPA: glycosyltransferase family 2 protein, partial [Verrucomicrobiae bacterium]|nr:glycosyltransferase family 2 protein [Verrucomicrobiae bacterium]
MTALPPLTPDQLTIAVTVYSRREYVKRAVTSALGQTLPVRVMVVEDCGPDATLQDYVKAEFGDRIQYMRNPKRRGLFDNWNACVDYCRTPWLSILHDDDYLAPNCVESMVALARQQPGCALYYGHYKVADETGAFRPELGVAPIATDTQQITLHDVYRATPIAFAGTV